MDFTHSFLRSSVSVHLILACAGRYQFATACPRVRFLLTDNSRSPYLLHMRMAIAKWMLTATAVVGVLALVGCWSEPPRPPPHPMPPATAPAPVAHRPVEPSPPPPAITVTPVVVVRATSSAPNDAERSYSGKIALRLADWLKESGLPVTPASDDDVVAGRLNAARIAILAYNPDPGFREMMALRRFAGHGGKLVVFYSSSASLASLMGLQLGAIQTATAPGQWAWFHFLSGAPAGCPPQISQESRIMRPVLPASRSARVIATWETATGKSLQDPAWLASDRGFWMTHILLEGDVATKKQMLVAILGACDQTFWQAAAGHSIRAAGTMGRFRDTADAVRRLGALAPGDTRVQPLLAQAENLQAEMMRSFRSGDYPGTLGTGRLLESALTEAYACAQAPRPAEFRGVWNHSGLGLYPGNWDETCAVLARNGFTAVFPNVQKPGTALYRNRLIPENALVAQLGDQLAAAVEAGQRRHIDVHAWVILWNVEGEPEPQLTAWRRAGRLQVSASGEPLDWLCPSNPENRAYELNAIRDVATRYGVAGIHLDYVRYKSGDYCYCRGCRERFARDTGLTPRRWPADVRTGPLATTYRDWRRGRITTFVAAVRDTLRRVNPSLKLSAAVYPGYPGCRDSIAQDWGEWLRGGLLDFACPMNYSEDTGKIVEWYGKQTAYPGVRGRLCPGIGVTATESRLSAADTIDQIAALRREGAGGFVLFELNRTVEKDILPYLRMGLTSDAGR